MRDTLSAPVQRDAIFAGLRITSGVSLIYYNLFVVLPQFDQLFGPESMVVPELFDWYLYSPLFVGWHIPGFLRGAFVIMVLALGAFSAGIYPRYAQFVALFLVISFHHANPFMAHEPQLLSNLLLFLLLFVPVEQRWTLRVSPRLKAWAPASVGYERWLVVLLLGYLGFYYFFAGLKKLPDPMWRSGEALGALIVWPPLQVEGFLRDFLETHPAVGAFGTYAALIFEMGFVAVAFTRFRRFLIPMGIIFHFFINATLEVGHFAVAILAWYPLLLASTRDLTPWRPRGAEGLLRP